MSVSHKAPPTPSELTARELAQLIPEQEGARLLNIHPDTFNRHFGHLAIKVGPRLRRYRLGDVLAIGQSKG